MKRKRVLHLTNIPTPYRVSFFNCLHHNLSLKNIELIVIYVSWREPRRLWDVDPKSLDYYWIDLNAYCFEFKNYIFWIDITIIWKLLKYRPDILFVAGSWNMPSALLSVLLPFKFKKIFWCEGHSKNVLHRGGVIASLRRFIYSKYQYFAIPNRASKMFVEQELSRSTQTQTYINLPNTIDEKVFKYPSLCMTPCVKKRLVITAALEERKGWYALLEGFRLLSPSEISSFEFYILGDGHLRTKLKASLDILGLTYFFYGQREPEFIATTLSNCHGFILPSLIDANPLSVIEAICVGLPILVSDRCGNYRECVQPSVNGWIFDPSNPEQIASSLSEWLQCDFKVLSQMAAMSKKIYANQFDQQAVCNSFVESLEEVLALNE